MIRPITLVCCLLLLSSSPIFSQTPNKLNPKTPTSSSTDKEFIVEPLKPESKNTSAYQRAASVLKGTIDKFTIASLADDYPAIQKQLSNTDHFILQLPAGQDKMLKLTMQRQQITTPDFVVKTSDGRVLSGSNHPGNYYSGTIDQAEKSLAAISFDGYGVKGFVSDKDGNKVIEALPKNKTGLHILYNDNDLLVKPEFICKTEDNITIPIAKVPTGTAQRPQGSCKTVKMYVECSYALYLANNSNVDDVINFVFSLFNASAAVYKSDGINIQLSEMFIWTGLALNPYGIDEWMQTRLMRNFKNGIRLNADIAHYITSDNLNGGMAYNTGISDACGKATGNYTSAMSSSISPFPDLPSYSWTVHVFAHETGHMLGSPHTQSCIWPGGAIDNCHATEGSCPKGPAPVNGGTMMSYCHNTTYGVNFLNGFGPLPSTLIRREIENNPCISLCADTACSNSPIQLLSATLDDTIFKIKWRKDVTKYKVGVRPNTTHQWQFYEVMDADSFAIAKTRCESFFEYSITPFCADLNKYGISYQASVRMSDVLQLQFKSYLNQALCAGDSTIVAVSPKGDFVYHWYIDGVIQPAFVTDSIKTPFVGKYSAMVEQNGCKYYSDTFTVLRLNQNPRIVVLINNLTVDFSVTATCSKIYLWDFGDGEQSSEKIVSHHYRQKGMYNVTLKVWDAAGKLEQVQKPLHLLDEYIDSLNGSSKYGIPSYINFATSLCRQVAVFSKGNLNVENASAFIQSRISYQGNGGGNTMFKTNGTGTLEFKLYPHQGLVRSTQLNSLVNVRACDTGYVLNTGATVLSEKNRFFLFFSKWGGVQVAVDSIVLGSIDQGVAGPLRIDQWNNIGISYGKQGISVIVNGQLYAKDTHIVDSMHALLLRTFNFGTYVGRPGYNDNAQLMHKGFEGAIDLIRFSTAENNFTFSAEAAWQGTDTVVIHRQICNGDNYLGYNKTGTYYRSSVTAAGCDSITAIHLLVNEPIDVRYNMVHPLDSAKGNIFISNTTGAVEPLKYEWSTGAITKDLLNVGAGKYSLKITDSVGCEKMMDYTLYRLNSQRDDLYIFPNPVAEGSELKLRILSVADKKYSCIIYDVAGRRCFYNSISAKAGVTETTIQLNLLRGAYVMHLQSGKELHSIPFYVK